MQSEVRAAQDEDGEEEEEDAEDSEADGFVVPNGYVSEGEGVASAQQELDAQAGDLSEGARLIRLCQCMSISQVHVLAGGAACAWCVVPVRVPDGCCMFATGICRASAQRLLIIVWEVPEHAHSLLGTAAGHAHY